MRIVKGVLIAVTGFVLLLQAGTNVAWADDGRRHSESTRGNSDDMRACTALQNTREGDEHDICGQTTAAANRSNNGNNNQGNRNNNEPAAPTNQTQTRTGTQSKTKGTNGGTNGGTAAGTATAGSVSAATNTNTVSQDEESAEAAETLTS